MSRIMSYFHDCYRQSHCYAAIAFTIARAMGQCFAASCLLGVFLFHTKVNAADWEVQLHQGADKETQGYSLALSDSFTRRSSFYWYGSYNQFRDVVYPWHGKDQLLPLSTLDATIGYRLNNKSFNARANGLSFEIALGAAVVLSGTELTFPQADPTLPPLPTQQLTEKGDISPLLVTSFRYKLSRSLALTFGVKHLAKVSALGSTTTAYLGFSYQVGSRRHGL